MRTRHGAVIEMDDDERVLYRLYQEHRDGGGGSRDELPYTTAFDQMRDAYNTETGQTLSHHEFWQTLCNLLKAGESNIDSFLGL